MNSLASALVFCLLLTPQKVGEVETHADKAADFSALHTYAWSKGHDAFDPRAHKAIIAEVETQMTALGFTQAPGRIGRRPADVSHRPGLGDRPRRSSTNY